MQMSIVKLPRYDMYWANETKTPRVSEVMSRNRYKSLRKYLHVRNNSEKDLEENKNDKLFKISPVLDRVRKNCLQTEPEQNNSIDEQIIPAKRKYSGIRQYNPKKPKKWDFKNFVRSEASGMMYDFFLYNGAATNDRKKVKVTGPYAVRKLLETFPKNQHYRVFFDNWFCTLVLCLKLKSLGFLVSATERSDQNGKCPLKAEKYLKKESRGSYDYRTDMGSGLVITKRFDSKCVYMCSTYVSLTETTEVKRWDRSASKYINVQCPEVVREYNKSMGGADLSDMLISP